jgi:hypothetical protein
MVSVQAHCTPDEALCLIEQRAREMELTVEEVAAAVVDRRLRFVVESLSSN